MDRKDHINVSVRLRPVLNQDNSSCSSLQIISKEPPVLLVTERSQTYHFDNIFSEDADQEKIYNDAVKPFIEFVKKGYNCTVFAYGQTGTGKTYTMGSGSQRPDDQRHVGIIPRALEQLFDKQFLNSEEEIEICVSFSEIYNEKVFDLLQRGEKNPLQVSGFQVPNLTVHRIRTVGEAYEMLELGSKNRHVGQTKQNLNSSRSHAIFTVSFIRKTSLEEMSGKLNLVDLAGSESVRKTGSKGNTFQEGININRGLLAVGQVISALSQKKKCYIPYRESVLTSILQGSLNINNYISLIACISANSDDIIETLQTLDFAQRAARIRSNPDVNQLIAKFKKDNYLGYGSCRTPMKRPSATPLKNSAVKKMMLHPLPLINESTQSQISNVDSSKSQSSINFSSVMSHAVSATSATEIHQQTFSPVIRKYMAEMEASIMDRLETVIKSTLRRPTRATLLAEKSRADNEKENTPNLAWGKIQNEVSKMVRSEIAQMSVKATNTVRATSSPIEDTEKITARRLFDCDSPDNLGPPNSGSATPWDKVQTNFSFKAPERPPQKTKLKSQSKLSMSISPIEGEIPKLTPRRSLRMSLKQSDNNNNTPDMFDVPDYSKNTLSKPRIQDQSRTNVSFKRPEPPQQRQNGRRSSKLSASVVETENTKPTPRRSTRLSTIKLNSIIDSSRALNISAFQDNTLNNVCENSGKDISGDCEKMLEASSACSNGDETLTERKDLEKRVTVRRTGRKRPVKTNKTNCSTRLHSPIKKRRNVSFNVAKTPPKVMVNRALKKQASKDSPFTAHSKRVLSVLNHGTLKDVQRLASIGIKTAERILLFRKLKGNFANIEDLSKLPGWGLKKYENFITMNFLNKD